MNIEEAIEIINDWNRCEELVIREESDYDKTVYIKRKQAQETVLAELEKKDKRLNRQFKLLQKKDKEIEELKADNNHQWEERCKLTFELEKKDMIIDLMAEQLTTDIHSKEWVIDYYEREVK